jgi:branched-chain amino acid transport system permease protein
VSLDFLLNAAVMVAIYYLLASALNLQYGVAGLLNLGVHGIFGLGAYTFALLTQLPGSLTAFALGLPWPVAAGVAVVACAAASMLLVLPAAVVDSRSRNPYLLPILLLAVSDTVVVVLSTRNGLAGGFAGVFGVPQPLAELTMGLDQEQASAVYLALVLAVAAVATLVVAALVHSPFGRAAKAVRDDEVEVRALGRSPLRYQLVCTGVGGALMGAAGVLWAGYLTTLQPSGFGISETLIVLIAVIAGGRGSVLGCVFGSVLVFGVLDQATRFLPNEVTTAVPGARQILLGVVLVLLLRYRPSGVWPERPRRFRRAWAAAQAHGQHDPRAVDGTVVPGWVVRRVAEEGSRAWVETPAAPTRASGS